MGIYILLKTLKSILIAGRWISPYIGNVGAERAVLFYGALHRFALSPLVQPDTGFAD